MEGRKPNQGFTSEKSQAPGKVHDIAAKRRRGRPAGGGKAKAVTKAKSELPPKFMDPKTGATWSGRGRAPAWLGKNRTKFLIPEA
ncbi:H-NS family nucleoid-associated regulatory protein [Cupriavidus sp. CP313]